MTQRSLLNGVIWQLAGSWGTRVVTLLVFALLARLLSPADMGTVSYVLGLLLVVLALSDLAISEFLVYRQDAGPAYASAIWWFQVAGSTVLAAMVSVVALAAPALLLPADVEPALLLAAAWTLPLLAAGKVPEALMRREIKGFRTLALRAFFVAVAGAVVALPLAWAGYGAWSLIAKQWVEVVVGLALFFPRGAWRPDRQWGWPQLKEALASSWGLMGSRLLELLSQRLDVLLIGSLIGLHELGLYTVAQKLYQVLQGTVLGAVYGVMNTRLGALRAKPDEFRRFVLVAVVGAALAVSGTYLVGLAAGGPFLELVFGAKWAASVPLLQIFLLGALLTALLQGALACYVCLTLQDNKAVFAIYLADLLATVAACVLAAPWGIEAVAAACAAKSLFVSMLWWRRGLWHLGTPTAAWLRALAPNLMVVGVAGAAWGLGLWLQPVLMRGWLGVAVLLLAYGLAWAVLLRWQGPLLARVRAELHR
jgi:O-antigen/teichoic acid export membrane protein